VDLYFPAEGQEYVDRLLNASIAHRLPEVRQHPVASDGLVDAGPRLAIHARALDHSVPAYGWRLEESPRRRMRPDLLAEHGIHGADVGRLLAEGVIHVGGRSIAVEEVSEPRPGQVVAFVMDTRVCRAAVVLAQGADLLVCESTFLGDEADLAAAYGHLTASDAAEIALRAGARRLVLTHFSQRHPDESLFGQEARAIFPDVHAARDLDRIPVPSRL
jgi:ribonuclease Z